MSAKPSGKSTKAEPVAGKNSAAPATAKKLRLAASPDRVLVLGGDKATSAFAAVAALAVSLRRELYRVDFTIVFTRRTRGARHVGVNALHLQSSR